MPRFTERMSYAELLSGVASPVGIVELCDGRAVIRVASSEFRCLTGTAGAAEGVVFQRAGEGEESEEDGAFFPMIDHGGADGGEHHEEVDADFPFGQQLQGIDGREGAAEEIGEDEESRGDQYDAGATGEGEVVREIEADQPGERAKEGGESDHRDQAVGEQAGGGGWSEAGVADLARFLDANDLPAAAVYLSWKILRWFVNQNISLDPPDPAVLELADYMRGSDGAAYPQRRYPYDLRACMRRLFLSQFFYSPENYFAITKTPADFCVMGLRIAQAGGDQHHHRERAERPQKTDVADEGKDALHKLKHITDHAERSRRRFPPGPRQLIVKFRIFEVREVERHRFFQDHHVDVDGKSGSKQHLGQRLGAELERLRHHQRKL